VVERTKKGKPAETRMMTTTSNVGYPPPSGFHEAPGVIADGHRRESEKTSRNAINNNAR
jgi:hypothetical protein